MSDPSAGNRRPASALMAVPGAERAPSLEQAALHLGVPVEALSREFGVILFDPVGRRYAVEVDAEALKKIVVAETDGPFSNPTIAPLKSFLIDYDK